MYSDNLNCINASNHIYERFLKASEMICLLFSHKTWSFMWIKRKSIKLKLMIHAF